MKHRRTKTRFETWITRNVEVVCLWHLSYLITVMAYLWLQWTQNVQINYVDWSIYRRFVLNMAWKRDSLQMLKLENVCSTLSMVQMKTRFETWLTGNDVSLFNLSYLITLMASVCSQRTKISKLRFLCLIGRSTDHLCQIRPGNVILSKWWCS
jgi:hypothetical protein